MMSLSGFADSLVWHTTRAEAEEACRNSGKLILLLTGRETCGNCKYMKYTVCEAPGVRELIDANYEPWFCPVDTSTEWFTYGYDLPSFTLPLMCVIDPRDFTMYLDRTTGTQSVSVFMDRLSSYVLTRAITVTPSALDFGSVSVGETADLTFTVENDGEETRSGEATVSAPFSIVSGGTYSLGAGQSQAVTVRYSPTSKGSHSSNVFFTGDGQVTRTVSGNAVLPNSAPTSLTLSAASVAENQAVKTTVGVFSTEDPDAGDTFIYALVNGAGDVDNGTFSLSGNTLRTATVFDYETKSSYSIRVRTTDQGGLYFEKTVVIQVLDLNDFSTVTFNARYGSVNPTSAIVTNGLTYGTLPVPVRSGYVFGGWWTGAGGTGPQVTATTTVTTTKNHYLYAKWTAIPPVALPTWAQGTFNGYVEGGGTASMTVSTSGKASGKISMAGTNYTFNTASYAAGGDSTNGFSVTVEAKAGKSALPLELVVKPAVSPEALGVATGTLGGDVPVILYRNVWGSAAATLTPFIGYYTVTLPGNEEYGSGYLTFTVDKAGKVKVGGKLADGTAVSQSGTLILDEEGQVFSVIYTAPTAYKGGCLFGLAQYVSEMGKVFLHPLKATFQWSSRSPQATENYGVGFERSPGLVGGWYSRTDNLYDYYRNGRLAIGTDTGAAVPEITLGALREPSVWWTPDGIELTVVTNKVGVMTGLTAPKAGTPVKNADGTYDYAAAENTLGLKVNLTRATGIFKGAYKAWFDYGTTHTSKSISYEGVLTPVREDMDDGVAGRGFFLWADKSLSPAYAFTWSYDLVLMGGQ